MQFDSFYIKEVAKRRSVHLRYGQAIYIVAYALYPKEVDRIQGTYFDCFNIDEKVNCFLEKLQFEIEHPLGQWFFVQAIYKKDTFYRLGESMNTLKLKGGKV